MKLMSNPCIPEDDDYNEVIPPVLPLNEFWHVGADGEGACGPFDTIEEAQADALPYLHELRWRVPKVKIMKVVATSETKTSHETKWWPQ